MKEQNDLMLNNYKLRRYNDTPTLPYNAPEGFGNVIKNTAFGVDAYPCKNPLTAAGRHGTIFPSSTRCDAIVCVPTRPRETAMPIETRVPCGYCFQEWATGVDHLIPQSYRVDNSESNLYPSCGRCNSILGDRIFGSIEEKREYVRDKLIERGIWKEGSDVQRVQQNVSDEALASEVLFNQMQKGELGETTPSHEYSTRIRGVKYLCEFCNELFSPTKKRQRYCSKKCRWQAWFERTYVKIER